MSDRVQRLLQMGVVALFCAGCFRSGPDLPKTIPVSGTVSYRGDLLKQGTIQFEPTESLSETVLRPATGIIDKHGRYPASTFRNGDGVMPGNYRVTIKSYVGEVTLDTPEAEIVWAIPKRYGQAETSGLDVSIPEKGTRKLVLDFELTD